jgi:hypothetical protein
VTTEPEQRYQIWFQPAARRAIPQRFPWQLPAGIGEQIGLSIGYAVCPASSGRLRPIRLELWIKIFQAASACAFSPGRSARMSP